MSNDDRRPDAEDDERRVSPRRAPSASSAGEPRRNWLRRIIGRGPSERKRLGEAVAALLGTALVAVAAIGGLVIWHLARRGRLIRERLDPPKSVRMPELHGPDGDAHDDPHDEFPPA